MVATRQLQVRDGDVLLLVGTVKGAFLAKAGSARATWDVGGPHFPGHLVYAMAYDDRAGRHRLWASTQSLPWGVFLRTSDDFGRTWTQPAENPVRFPEDTGATLKQIWQIRPGRPDEPDVLYCGVEPAALFESRDNGATFSLVRSLWDHPHRQRWQPGGGGLCLHTILPHPRDPKQMLVAVSTAGVYRTIDGGRSWHTAHKGVRAEFLPDKHPEFGQCVHKVAQNSARPERYFLQNHWGLYRSDDGADSWSDVANGVPSDFGFAMAVHPRDPDTAYIVPLEADEFRCTPEGKLRVYKTRNAGGKWEPLTRGLPQKGAYETVLRDALEVDTLAPAGIYFGTRSGKLFASRDEGKSWRLVADGLPPIVCVKTAVVGESKKRRARPASRKPVRRPARKPAGRAARRR